MNRIIAVLLVLCCVGCEGKNRAKIEYVRYRFNVVLDRCTPIDSSVIQFDLREGVYTLLDFGEYHNQNDSEGFVTTVRLLPCSK